MVDLENLSYDDLDTIPKLQKTLRYIETMLKVEDALERVLMICQRMATIPSTS